MAKLIMILFLVGLLVGCEYVPLKVFEIKTTDGKTIKLLCPVVERDRSKMTYVIDQECRVIKD